MLVKKSHNTKKRVKKSNNAAKNKAERKRNSPRMSITTLIILCTVVPLLLGGFANYFAHKAWILYLPLTGLLVLLGYLGHLGIRSLANSRSAGALQFSVASEGGFTTTTRDVATRFCLALWHADEYVAVPITDLMLVWFTNSEVTPTMINYYSIEVRVRNGKWQNVLCLNGLNGKLFMRGKTVNVASEITLDARVSI